MPRWHQLPLHLKEPVLRNAQLLLPLLLLLLMLLLLRAQQKSVQERRNLRRRFRSVGVHTRAQQSTVRFVAVRWRWGEGSLAVLALNGGSRRRRPRAAPKKETGRGGGSGQELERKQAAVPVSISLGFGREGKRGRGKEERAAGEDSTSVHALAQQQRGAEEVMGTSASRHRRGARNGSGGHALPAGGKGTSRAPAGARKVCSLLHSSEGCSQVLSEILGGGHPR